MALHGVSNTLLECVQFGVRFEKDVDNYRDFEEEQILRGLKT